MRALARWLLARRVGRVEADRFLEELDELHTIKREAEGAEAGDRWMRRELRLALWNGLGPSMRESGGKKPGDDRSPAPTSSTPGILRDLRFALRTLRRRPLFAGLVIGTLGLGIGASTTVFSLVDGILLEDMAYERPGELVAIWGAYPSWKEDPLLQEAWDKIGLRWSTYQELRDRAESFSGIAGHRAATLTITGSGDAARLDTGEATANLFHVLGIRPFLGRTFLPGEEGPGAPRVAVLGYDEWRSRFGSDSTVVGSTVTLNGESFEVIGVLPPGVRIHSKLYNLFTSSIDQGERAVWVPMKWDPAGGTGSQDVETLGRILPGVPREQALAEVQRLVDEAQPDRSTVMRLTSPREEIVAGFRSPLLLLLGASGLLLLIACGNAATLLLGEAIDRRGEIATRIAMGAGRGRIAQQLLAESLVLGLAGSLVGILLAPAGLRAFLALGPALPRLQNVAVDQGVLLMAALSGVACALLFGFAPALLQHKHSLHALLQREGRGRLGGGGRAQTALLAGELALTVVLMISAGLLARSLGELGRVDPGFRAQGVATIRVEVPSGYFSSDREEQRVGVHRFRQRVWERVQALPGVLQAGAIDGLPFPGLISGSTFVIDGVSRQSGEQVMARDHAVTPGYFQAMGIPLLAGRDFTEADAVMGDGGVAVINETMARRFWPGESPLDHIVGSGPNPYRIVGVVGDVRERHLAEEPHPMVYRHAYVSGGSFSVVARVAGDPEALVPLLREAVRAVDPEIPLTQETTMASLVAGSEGAERFRAFLVSGFGILAILLAMVGVFGVTARNVAHRARELGIRMALGAEVGSLVRMAALRTLRAGAAGIVLGLAGALGLTRLLTAFLYGTEPWDAWTWSGTVLLLVALCTGAAGLAAHRVIRVEPMRVLREE